VHRIVKGGAQTNTTPHGSPDHVTIHARQVYRELTKRVLHPVDSSLSYVLSYTLT
jgi:hypothetical protein